MVYRKQLGLIPNEFGILICHGRFLNADVVCNAKYPIATKRALH